MNPPHTQQTAALDPALPPALRERAEATAAWLETFGELALDPSGDLLLAVSHELRQRGWSMQLDIGNSVTGKLDIDGDEDDSKTHTDVAAAMAWRLLNAERARRRAAVPALPRRRLSFAGWQSPQQVAAGPHGGAEKVQGLFNRLAKGYGFGPGEGTFTEGGGTRTYRQDGFTLELTAQGEQARPGRRFVYSGLLTRHFSGDAPPLTHALPVGENSQYSGQFENRHWRESTELFAGDLAQAVTYINVPDEDGWAHGHVAKLHAGQGTGFIRNHSAERIRFHQDALTPLDWLPTVDHPVRFRCANVVQSSARRPSAYRALSVAPVDVDE